MIVALANRFVYMLVLRVDRVSITVLKCTAQRLQIDLLLALPGLLLL